MYISSKTETETERQTEATYTYQKWSGGPSACGSFVTPKPGRKTDRGTERLTGRRFGFPHEIWGR